MAKIIKHYTTTEDEINKVRSANPNSETLLIPPHTIIKNGKELKIPPKRISNSSAGYVSGEDPIASLFVGGKALKGIGKLNTLRAPNTLGLSVKTKAPVYARNIINKSNELSSSLDYILNEPLKRSILFLRDKTINATGNKNLGKYFNRVYTGYRKLSSEHKLPTYYNGIAGSHQYNKNKNKE